MMTTRGAQALTRRGALMGGFCSGVVTMAGAQSNDLIIEDFSGTPADRWEFISDQVMGGQSQGRVTLARDGNQTALHLQGQVSTANNGGFLQARRKLQTRLPATAQGLELTVRGNGQRYFVHARTNATVLPWTYYQAAFDVTSAWTTLRVPFSQFRAEGRMLAQTLEPETIKSLAVVAFGRDHAADLWVARIAQY